MIILPDRKISRSSILMAVPRREWMRPSQAEYKDCFGNPGTRTLFRITACLSDGHIVWRGWFEDRDDADAFLYAAVSGSLQYEKDLWRLPTPEWVPWTHEDVTFYIAVTTFLTTTGGATYTSPSDWNNSSNTIEGIGGGASGGRGVNTGTSLRASGGGAGEYRKIANFTFATPGTTTASYTVGTGGAAGVTTSASSASAFGNPGANTTFNTTSLIAAAGSSGRTSTIGSATGGAGGSGGTGAAGNADGGAGGSCANSGSATGGGGAGGPFGAGNSGVASTTTNQATDGGSGDAGSGGSAGTAPGGTGGNGTEFQASPAYGSGGGGAGNSGNNVDTTAGSGGTYGAGGGAAGIRSITTTRTATSGAGIQGLIVITYTPASSVVTTNLAMMGM